MDIGRGFLRIWIVISIGWLFAVAWMMWPGPGVTIAWPWSAPPMIQVKFSDTEIWTYPAAWGIQRIRDDVTKKLAEENKREREWAAAVPAERKAFCEALSKSNTLVDKEPEDCVRLFWSSMEFVAPPHWEDQFSSLPIPVSRVASMVAPLAVGPPLLLLIVGLAFGWAIKGFRRGA